MKLSRQAEAVTTHPILVLAAEINRKKAQGATIYNLTVGDFDSRIFPIPGRLTDLIVEAYRDNQTNYPGAFGLDGLRQAVAELLSSHCQIDVDLDEIQIASGSRPLIYSLFKTVVDAGDKVVYPVPSWNNDNYTDLHDAEAVRIETLPENNFFPTADDLRPHIEGAVLLSLCSPQNPTGTLMDRQQLKAICDLVVEENRRRGEHEKPLYVMFDQVYWMLTFGAQVFHHPLAVCPDLRPYAVFIDGISKSLAATGVRVGWAHGPQAVISRMRAFIAHIGAWAPKPEQVAVGRFLLERSAVDSFLQQFRNDLQQRLEEFYRGFMGLKEKGYDIDAIAPQAAIYLSVRMSLKGRVAANGKQLADDEDVRHFLLDEVGIGVLPFSWFGARQHSDWYRISVGTCTREQVAQVLHVLEDAMRQLH